MNLLVVGSGGREHALVWKLKQSPLVETIYCAPGNAGIGETAELVDIKSSDAHALLEFAQKNDIRLTVVGPEQPLVDGIVDLFREHRLWIFGPTRAAARLEGSKAFAKSFMERHGIPTAQSGTFTQDQLKELQEFVHRLPAKPVVKVDGLAAGKGVVICDSAKDAIDVCREIFETKSFGVAGERIVIEEYLEGEEASFFILTDGKSIAPLSAAQDHKRASDGDRGKNTGGMGAYAPAPIITERMRERIIAEIVEPTIEGMRNEGTPYEGCLFVGLMMTQRGPKVLEYNCRFGDPEAQVLLPLIDEDLAMLFAEIAAGSLSTTTIKQRLGPAVCVVMASGGYPGDYEIGKEIHGLELLQESSEVIVFHAGTKREGSKVVTSGGRVLAVTAVGSDGNLKRTISKAYEAVEKISFEGVHYRRDIGKKGLKYFQAKQAVS